MNFNEAKIKLPEEIESLRKFGEKYKNAVPQVKKIIAKRIERGKFANQLKKQQNYECEICKAMGLNTTSFLKRNGVPYIKFIM
jgi:hypothetical protein